MKFDEIDFAALEARVMAQEAKGHDVITATAAEYYGVPIEKVTPIQRAFIKNIAFGLTYSFRKLVPSGRPLPRKKVESREVPK